MPYGTLIGGGEGTLFSTVSNGADYILKLSSVGLDNGLTPPAYYRSFKVRGYTLLVYSSSVWEISPNITSILVHPNERMPISRYRAVELLHILLGIAVDFTLRFHRSSRVFTCNSHCKATLSKSNPSPSLALPEWGSAPYRPARRGVPYPRSGTPMRFLTFGSSLKMGDLLPFYPFWTWARHPPQKIKNTSFKVFFLIGGGGGCRTHVRKHIHGSFSERI